MPDEDFSWSEINQNLLVGFVWSLLRGTEYEKLHDQRGFKFFTFSELFPFGDFRREEPKYLIVSSPDPRFVSTLARRAEEIQTARLGTHPLQVRVDKVFRLRARSEWLTGSPVVVRRDDGRYWREDADTLGVFIEKLTQNAVAKYRTYTGDQTFGIDGPLFEELTFVKGVVHSFWKRGGQRVLVMGTKWRFRLPSGWRRYRPFYEFLMDCGLGEKNAMGYGFVNPVGGGRGD